MAGVVEAQNVLVEKSILEGFDYLWLVQADVQVPPCAFKKLYSLGVDVAQGVVPRHDDFNALICGFMDESMNVWYLPRNAVQGQILSGWVFAGLSCTLIKRRIFDGGIRFKYKPAVGEDVLFLYDVQSNGFTAKVHGGVLCGHLPEWPLPNNLSPGDNFEVLDVGCGHNPKGDVNVDLFPESTRHRSVDQALKNDKSLNVKEIPNFVKADGCRLPFVNGVFSKVFSSHTIEHVEVPELFVAELLRVCYDEVEIVCPHADSPWGCVEIKPLHINALTLEWFQDVLRKIPDITFSMQCNRFDDRPGDIFVKIWKGGLVERKD